MNQETVCNKAFPNAMKGFLPAVNIFPLPVNKTALACVSSAIWVKQFPKSLKNIKLINIILKIKFM